MLRLAIGRMDGDLGGWELENQPTVAGIDAGEPEMIAQERSISLRIAAVRDDVCPVEYGGLQLSEASQICRPRYAS